MYHDFLIHLSANGHLGCFHVLAIVKSAEHWSTCVFWNYGFLSIILVVGLLGHRVVRFIPSF